jgi:membrane peptidoglycan carboxypeptidase
VITLAAALASSWSPNTLSTAAHARAQVQGAEHDRSPRERWLNDLWFDRRSVNCAFVRLSTSVAGDKVMDMAHKMGSPNSASSTSRSRQRHRGPPLEMAAGVALIANDWRRAYFVRR